MSSLNLKALGERLSEWSESRGSGVDILRAFLTKPIPRNVGWVHTLGSLLLVYLGFQVLTGVLLGFYYSASTHDAYQSVRYVHDELFLGAFLLKLHRFGSGFIMVTAFLHLFRSYFTAAYKAPRELLWITGLALGVLLTLFAFTGQLLPYDQRGYWATVVGIDIASAAPGLGGLIRDGLTGGYGEIGPATLSRFYILHVAVLPLILVAGIAVHLRILQKVGSAGPLGGDDADPQRSFYPSQVLKDVAAAAVGALLLFAVAAFLSLEDTGPADPSSSSFVPRPELYFLSHYEILQWLPKVLGAFIVPNVVIGLLLLLPFLDRSPERRPSRRKLVTALGVCFCAAVVSLTIFGVATAPASEPTATIENPLVRGRELLTEQDCLTCHSLEGQGGDKGPALDLVARRIKPDYLPDWIRNPQNIDPGSEMPAFEGSEEELQAIVSFLLAPK